MQPDQQGQQAERKALVQLLSEEYVIKGNNFAANATMDPSYWEYSGSDEAQPGDRAQHDQGQADLRTAFPDLQSRIVHQVAEGDFVATLFTHQGTHRGPLMGIPASNKQISWDGIIFHRFSGNKIIEAHVYYDALGMIRQIVGEKYVITPER